MLETPICRTEIGRYAWRCTEEEWVWTDHISKQCPHLSASSSVLVPPREHFCKEDVPSSSCVLRLYLAKAWEYARWKVCCLVIRGSAVWLTDWDCPLWPPLVASCAFNIMSTLTVFVRMGNAGWEAKNFQYLYDFKYKRQVYPLLLMTHTSFSVPICQSSEKARSRFRLPALFYRSVCSAPFPLWLVPVVPTPAPLGSARCHCRWDALGEQNPLTDLLPWTDLSLLCRDRGGQAVGLRVQGGTCLTEMRWIFVWFLEKALVMCPDTPRTNNKLAGQVVQILLPHYSIPKLQKASLGKEFSFGSSVWS